ncbi:hypothetical protein MACH21_12600 [Roseicyclus marinus]|uniref:Transposase IS66 central domain-containing protein n=1 Tax=Roseicyclus marinus TaxID=2161673 RepID=A0AA48H8Y9_9RHOB|nr:hypothetical protein MACH21_12600 [Roseicyclus marinus]
MALIRDLCAIESEIRGSDPATRPDRSAPTLTRIDDWLIHHRGRASAKSPLGEALSYIAKYREGLGRFLTDGRVEIDSNAVERTIRPIALNKKMHSSLAMMPALKTGPSSPRQSRPAR